MKIVKDKCIAMDEDLASRSIKRGAKLSNRGNVSESMHALSSVLLQVYCN